MTETEISASTEAQDLIVAEIDTLPVTESQDLSVNEMKIPAATESQNQIDDESNESHITHISVSTETENTFETKKER